MTEPTLNDMMIAYAEDAVYFARDKFGVTLDYSADSVSTIETIAGKLHESMPRGFLGKLIKRAPSEQEIEIMCKMLGGYVGEVFRRIKGGDWGVNDRFRALGVRRGEDWIFPPTKVYKRITNGPEDNIWHFFKAVSDESFAKPLK